MRMHGWRLIALLMLPAMIGMTSPLSAQASALGRPSGVSLITNADDVLDRVCVGKSVEFNVIAIRRDTSAARVDRVVVQSSVQDPGVGMISPATGTTGESPMPSGVAIFAFSGLRPGATELRFNGVMRGGAAGIETETLKRRVTVVACDSPTPTPQATGSGGGSNNPGPPPRETVPPNTRLPAITKITVTTRSTWSVGMDIRATIEDAVLVDDGQGRFAGSASVTWWTSIIGSGACRAQEYTIPPSRASLTGAIDASNQLVVTITFAPRDFSGFATCMFTIATGNVGTLDPVTVTVPLSGGTLTQAHSVTAVNGSFVGSVTVVVGTEPATPK